jgi:NTP pyrophosphatase (non-canonical NTP hydrolase)
VQYLHVRMYEMNLNEYQEFCKSTAKKFDSSEIEILTWGLGIAGEAGDVASCIKKTVSHQNDVREGIKENLGDTLWYASMICSYFGWDLEEVLNENMAKLKKRYPEGFNVKSAQRKKIDWSER